MNDPYLYFSSVDTIWNRFFQLMSNISTLGSILVNLYKAIFIGGLYVLVSLTCKFYFRILVCIVYLTRHMSTFCFCFSQFNDIFFLEQPTSCRGLRLILFKLIVSWGTVLYVRLNIKSRKIFSTPMQKLLRFWKIIKILDISCNAHTARFLSMFHHFLRFCI